MYRFRGVIVGWILLLVACGGGSSSSPSSSGGGGTIASIAVAPTSASIAVGATQQFTATAKDSAGNTISGVSFTWASSNTGTATISSSGLATGIATGSTNITASASGVTSSVITLMVTPQLALAITITSLPNGTVGTAYSAILQASGGTQPYTWSISSAALPPGLTLNSSAGTLSGTPTATGTTSFTVQVTDSESPAVSATAKLSITVSNAGTSFSVWVSNGGNDSVTEITSAAISTGSCSSTICPTFTGGGMNEPGPLAVDANGNVWIVNTPIGAAQGAAPYSVTEITASAIANGNCSSMTCLNYTGGGLYGLEDIAVDMNGNAWIADSCPQPANFAASSCGFGNGGVTEIKPGATQDCSSGCAYFTIQQNSSGSPQLFPRGVTVDTQGDVWFTNDGCVIASNCPTNTGSVVKISLSSVQAGSCSSGCVLYSNGNIADPNGVAVDILGDAWVANSCGPANCLNFFGGSVTEIKNGSAQNCTSGCINFTGGGLFQSDAVAIDSNGNVWITNPTAPGITEITSAAVTGGACTSTSCISFNVGSIENGRKAMAIDPNGDIWVTARQELQEILPGAATDCSSGCIAFTLPQIPVAVAISK